MGRLHNLYSAPVKNYTKNLSIIFAYRGVYENFHLFYWCLVLLVGAAVDELFSHALTYFKQTVEVVKSGFLHSAVHPVDNLTEADALVKSYKNIFIIRVNLLFSEQLIYVSRYNIFADIEQAALEKLAICRIIYMVHGFSVFYGIANRNIKALVEIVYRRIPFYYSFCVLDDDRFNYGGQILKMVVKRISVYPAVLNDILYGYLIYRLFLKQLQNRGFYCGFCEI